MTLSTVAFGRRLLLSVPMVKINFTFEPGVTLNQVLSFEMAGQIWGHYLQDDIALDIHIAATEYLPDQVLGGSILTTHSIGVDVVEAALGADAQSDIDQTAVQSLDQDGVFEGILDDTVYQGNTITLGQAQLEALGINYQAEDPIEGVIVFNSLRQSDLNWSYGFDRTTPIQENSVDHLSVALHEIGHVLGFISGLDVPRTGSIQEQLDQTTLLDLFRYSDRSTNLGANDLEIGENTYFSLDQGASIIAPFSGGVIELEGNLRQGVQASHWGGRFDSTDQQPTSNPGLIFQLANPFLQLVRPIVPNFLFGITSALVQTTSQVSQALFNVLFNGRTIEVVTEDDGINVGIFDPTLTVGDRSSISTIDLIALDALGYDILDVEAIDLNYAELLNQAKGLVSSYSGLSQAELESGLQQDLIVGRNSEETESIAFDSDKIYERRLQRRRVTQNASFWQELEVDSYVEPYSISEQFYLEWGEITVETTTGVPDIQPNDSFPELESKYNVVTGNQNDVIQVWDGIHHLNTGLGNDLIVFGNLIQPYLAKKGDQDFVVIQDWNEADQLLLYGDRTQYTLREQELYFGNDLLAKFEGGIAFDLNSVQISYIHSGLGLETGGNNGAPPSSFPDIYANELIRNNLASADLMTQVDFLETTTGVSLEDFLGQINFAPPNQVEDQRIEGTMANDILFGSNADEILRSWHGDDQLVGGNGNDTLFGQGSDDTLNGTDRWAQGKLEKDVLFGGKGSDLFVIGDENGVYYHQNGNQDLAIIKDFSELEDQLQLHGRAEQYELKARQNHTEIHFEGDLITILQGVEISALESNIFL